MIYNNLNYMKILITGAAGFIGFNFSKFLLENSKFEILGIDNFCTKNVHNHLKNTTCMFFLDFEENICHKPYD